jgi:phosphoribosylformimino-5-aminoimidazole carboxamide ribotide isomerase
VHGWTSSAGVALHAALTMFPTAAAFVITDIARDGMLAGPDVEGLVAVVAATSIPVIASGGVATLDDVRELAAIPGLAGVITGRAIYEGRFTVADALAVLA